MKQSVWEKHIKDAWFRKDFAYAGKNFTKNNKTFIAMPPYLNTDGTITELTGFKTIQAAKNAADENWPLDD